MALTKQQRDDLPEDDFAVPGKRALPIHDGNHVRMAWDMVGRTKGLLDEEKKDARRRIIDRARTLGIDTADWERGKLSAKVSLSAMALNIENDDHPNKMPFSGILTFIDQPSDAAPEGSNGRLITITKEAAEGALKGILGMAVDYRPGFDGHAPQSKIGIITEATIEGNTLPIKGFIYATDFPEVAAEIRANKDKLGFSYEVRNLFCDDPDADPVAITGCVFTGAAILLKEKAAYRSTSLAAKAAEGFKMDKEVQDRFDALAASVDKLTGAMTSISASVDEVKKTSIPKLEAASNLAMIEPHAAACEAAADNMEKAGIGGHPSSGHVAVLRRMGASMRAEAAVGKIPHIYRDHDSLYAAGDVGKDLEAKVKAAVDAAIKPISDENAVLKTQIGDLKASATRAATPPERKTVSPQIGALLARAGIDVAATGEKIDIVKLDAALKDMPTEQRLHVKASLGQAGLIN